MPRHSSRQRRHLIHPTNNNDNTNSSSSNQTLSPNELSSTITKNPLTTTMLASEVSSSIQPRASDNNNDKSKDGDYATTNQLIVNLTTVNPNLPSSRNTHSLLAKLNDAKRSLFGRTNVPHPFFSTADENKDLLNYILSEAYPQLEKIQQFEQSGAQLNAITDEGNTAMHLLARAEIFSTERINIIDYLTKKGCDPNRQNDYGWTAAHYALANHNIDLVIYLLKVMVDVNLSTFDAHNGYPSQTQLLHIAARNNDSNLIGLLIKIYKARMNNFDEDGCTPLHICCYENNIEALKALLGNDADFQKGTRLNQCEIPVSICVKHQYDLCLRTLFDLTKNFNWKRYFSQLPRSPLLCDFPSIYAIELLVQHSLDIDKCDEHGNTFLHYLVNKKDIDYQKYIEKLIEISADFNRQNRLGRTSFLEALEQKNVQLIIAFLHHIESIDMNLVDSLSNTALHYCKYLDEDFICDAILQSNPVTLNAQNRDGQTPLHEAVLYDNYSFARYLLQNGADLSLKNKNENTPLHLAARNDNAKMCRLLMKYPQINLVATNKIGKTPLHLTCAHEKPNVAAILINKINIEQMNFLDIQGRTPLHECADNIDGSLAKYLIRHGADGNANDIRQNTVLHLATEKGNIELVRALIKSSDVNINQLNADMQSPLGLAILYNHDDISKFLLNQENIRIQSNDLKIAMQMNNYEMIKLLIEKDHHCLRVRSSTHGDMIIHTFMRKNFNNLVCLEILLSFVADNELLSYLSESSLACGDNLLHIAARDDTPNALTCFLNLSRVKFWFWANMMLTKNNENKTPMELANEFKHYAVIKLINSKWKESYEYLSHSIRDGHCGVSPTGVTQAKRRCFNCQQTGLIEATPGQNIRPCARCNFCLYKSFDNSMQIFLTLLFSDESSTIALDIMDSLIVVNEVQKAVHLYLDHIEPWEEFDKIDLNDSSNLNQLVYTTDTRMRSVQNTLTKKSSTSPIVKINAGISSTLGLTAQTFPLHILESTKNPTYDPQSSTTTKLPSNGRPYRPITPLEAIYYHERLDLITHPLIKGLIKWKWDNYAAKHFYLRLSLEVVYLIVWTCISLIGSFPVRYVYRFPQDIWRCILWTACIGLLVWGVVRDMFDINYSRKRYKHYLIWETERTQNRWDVISKNKYKSNTGTQLTNINHEKADHNTGDPEHVTMNEGISTIDISSNTNLPTMRSHHSQHHPLPPTIPTIIKGKPIEPSSSQQQLFDGHNHSSDPSNGLHDDSKKRHASNNMTNMLLTSGTNNSNASSSRFVQFLQRFKTRAKARLKAYSICYSLNNLFDWLVYTLCLITAITHFVDVGSHTVTHARIHMYVASVTVICIWFRFMVFFRTMSLTFKTLSAKLVEIKLGELIIMVRMMFDDIIRFLSVFVFLLIPYALVFFAVFGGLHIIHSDFEKASELCETALLHCPMVELITPYDGDPASLENQNQYIFNGTSSIVGDLCYNATNSCRLVQPNGFETFYSLLFSIFRIALVDDIPIDSFNLIDHYFGAFVCGTYLLFTAILAINIFIGLISNALQTEAFSTVEARFLLGRAEIILNYEWRLSDRRRLQLQETIHRQCAPLQLNWKEINFNTFGQTREEQQAKAFSHFRQTIDKHTTQFNTFRIQVQQKLNDIESTLIKLQSNKKPTRQNLQQTMATSSSVIVQEPTAYTSSTSKRSPENESTEQTNRTQSPPISAVAESPINIADELARLRQLIERTFAEQTDQTADTTRTIVPGSISSTTASHRATKSLLPSLDHDQQTDASSTIVETHHNVHIQSISQNLNERIDDLQLAVNHLHQDVTAVRQVIERMSPLSTSVILGRTSGRR